MLNVPKNIEALVDQAIRSGEAYGLMVGRDREPESVLQAHMDRVKAAKAAALEAISQELSRRFDNGIELGSQRPR